MYIKKVSFLLLALLAFLQLTPAAHAASSDWEARYWTNTTLSGDPALVRQESNLDHDWGDGSPIEPAVETFSARFRRTLNVPAGTYRFTATMDDGMRFWIDGALVIDSWTNSQVHSLTADYHLSSGDHSLKVEYYDAGGAAVAKLSWTALSLDNSNTTVSNWRGEYFNNQFLSGTPSLVRDDQSINFNWGTGAPAAGIAADGFSVRWTRSLNLDAGRYRFTAMADDGMRVWVNGRLLVDRWQDQAATSVSAEIDLAGGSVPVQMEYYESVGGASASLTWQQIGGTTITNWKGEYFNNTTLSGTPILVRDDANIAFNWGNGSPAPNVVNADNFSVRWTRTLPNSAAGRYRFTANVDDGVRVWVNGQLVINAWSDHTPQEFVGEMDFAGGNMNIVVEYYENSGGARANLTRTQITTTNVPSVPSAPAGATATVSSLRLNVRSGPGVTNPVTVVLNQGQSVSLLARNTDTTWLQVVTPTGTQGWAYAPLLYTTYPVAQLPLGQGLPSPAAPSGPVATVSNAVYALNVRSGPGTTFNILTAVPRGGQVSLIGRNSFNTWLKIRLASGAEGWSSANYLNTTYTLSNLPIVNN